jgi:transposase
MEKLKERLSSYWLTIQSSLFPWLKEEVGDLTEKQMLLITVLETIRIEEYIPNYSGLAGRPQSDRVAIARAFIAKAVYNMSTTRMLIDRLECDIALRRICGWEKKNDMPSESTFSRAFTELATRQLLEQIHESLIKDNYEGEIVGHLSRDATKIEAREKPIKKVKDEKPKRKRGRPKKGEEVVKEPTRLERQSKMNVEEMLDDLPKDCDIGCKKNSKGHTETWIGYKLHIDTIDGQLPISCMLTSASTHDSQVAIPLASISGQRVTNLYDLMDAAYDAPAIKNKSLELEHVPIIDINPRRNKALKEELQAENQRLDLINFELPEQIRYRERSASERVNGRLKDEFGGRHVRVRGHAKVLCHLMFGILVITVDQLMRLVN